MDGIKIGGLAVGLTPIVAASAAYASATNRKTISKAQLNKAAFSGVRKILIQARLSGGAGSMPLMKVLINGGAVGAADANIIAKFAVVTNAGMEYFVWDPKLNPTLELDYFDETRPGYEVIQTLDFMPMADDGVMGGAGAGVSPSNYGVAAADVDLFFICSR